MNTTKTKEEALNGVTWTGIYNSLPNTISLRVRYDVKKNIRKRGTFSNNYTAAVLSLI